MNVNTLFAIAGSSLIVAVSQVDARDGETDSPSVAQRGDHPAIIVKRNAERAGYDYASKFYPHPAWLYLAPEQPRELGHHPAVIIAKNKRRHGDETMQFASHPALGNGAAGRSAARAELEPQSAD